MSGPNFQTEAQGGNGFPMFGDAGLPLMCGPDANCCEPGEGCSVTMQIPILIQSAPLGPPQTWRFVADYSPVDPTATLVSVDWSVVGGSVDSVVTGPNQSTAIVTFADIGSYLVEVLVTYSDGSQCQADQPIEIGGVCTNFRRELPYPDQVFLEFFCDSCLLTSYVLGSKEIIEDGRIVSWNLVIPALGSASSCAPNDEVLISAGLQCDPFPPSRTLMSVSARLNVPGTPRIIFQGLLTLLGGFFPYGEYRIDSDRAGRDCTHAILTVPGGS